MHLDLYESWGRSWNEASLAAFLEDHLQVRRGGRKGIEEFARQPTIQDTSLEGL